MPEQTFSILAKTFAGLEEVLAVELRGIAETSEIQPGRRMVSLTGTQRTLYEANLACRAAVRVLKPIHTFDAAALAAASGESADRALYAGVGQIDWPNYLGVRDSLAIDPVVFSPLYKNSLYAAQLAKDAIVDQFRSRFDQRPNVNLDNPTCRINLHISGSQVTVYLDASGDSLHKRGYRQATGEAPLNEVLAAGLIYLSGWDPTTPLADFMCGSGTFAIEAALMQRGIFPGQLRRQYGYMNWPDYDAQLDQSIHEQLAARSVKKGGQAPRESRLQETAANVSEPVPFFSLQPTNDHGGVLIQASDIDANMIRAARQNASAAKVQNDLELSVSNFCDARPRHESGTLIVNPPYDERLRVEQVAGLYRRIGDALKQHWSGWTAWIFTGNLEAARQIGLKPSQRIPLYNGPIECRFLRFDLYAGRAEQRQATSTPVPAEPETDSTQPLPAPSETPIDDEPDAEPGKSRHASRSRTWQDQAADFRNRLTRMSKHWAKWARRQDISCYRIYDRDVPEIPLSIDWYAGHLVVRVYGRPHERSGVEQQIWQREMIETARAALDVPKSHEHAPDVEFSQTSRQPAPAERGDSRPLREVAEAGLRLLVDLDASATGLTLDERVLRSKVREEAAGKRFLNLWGRSGVTTLFAAAGGASRTVTVDAWPANLKWTRENLELNGITRRDHALVEADPRDFLRGQFENRDAFDLIVLRPPAPRATDDFARAADVQRDLDELVDMVSACLAPGGKAYFVTSATRFKLTGDRIGGVSIRDISRQTVPQDFRNKKVHRCWLLQKT